MATENLSVSVVREPSPLALPKETSGLSPVQVGWLNMANLKEFTVKCLTQDELSIQSYLNGIEKKTDLKVVQVELEKAKQLAATSKDQRLQFTNIIKDKLVGPMMLFEKRNEELIKKASEHELKLREIAEKEEEKGNELQQEEAAFKAHFENQYFIIAANFRGKLAHMIQHYYERALLDKVKPADIKAFKDGIEPIIRAAIPEKPEKFNRVLIKPERAAELFKSIKPYTHAIDIAQAVKDIDTKFSMYAQDFKNREAAIESSKKELENKIAEEKKKVEVEVATNTLVASATAVKQNTVKVKRKTKIVVKETEQFALQILCSAIANWNNIKDYLKVEKWSNLKIDQLAAALSRHICETGEVLPGFETEEIKK